MSGEFEFLDELLSEITFKPNVSQLPVNEPKKYDSLQKYSIKSEEEERLKKENAKLRSRLRAYSKSLNEQGARLTQLLTEKLSLREEQEKIEDCKKKLEEANVYIQATEQLNKQLHELAKSYENDKKELSSKIQTLQRKVRKLKKEINGTNQQKLQERKRRLKQLKILLELSELLITLGLLPVKYKRSHDNWKFEVGHNEDEDVEEDNDVEENDKDEEEREEEKEKTQKETSVTSLPRAVTQVQVPSKIPSNSASSEWKEMPPEVMSDLESSDEEGCGESAPPTKNPPHLPIVESVKALYKRIISSTDDMLKVGSDFGSTITSPCSSSSVGDQLGMGSSSVGSEGSSDSRVVSPLLSSKVNTSTGAGRTEKGASVLMEAEDWHWDDDASCGGSSTNRGLDTNGAVEETRPMVDGGSQEGGKKVPDATERIIGSNNWLDVHSILKEMCLKPVPLLLPFEDVFLSHSQNQRLCSNEKWSKKVAEKLMGGVVKRNSTHEMAGQSVGAAPPLPSPVNCSYSSNAKNMPLTRRQVEKGSEKIQAKSTTGDQAGLIVTADATEGKSTADVSPTTHRTAPDVKNDNAVVENIIVGVHKNVTDSTANGESCKRAKDYQKGDKNKLNEVPCDLSSTESNPTIFNPKNMPGLLQSDCAKMKGQEEYTVCAKSVKGRRGRPKKVRSEENESKEKKSAEKEKEENTQSLGGTIASPLREECPRRFSLRLRKNIPETKVTCPTIVNNSIDVPSEVDSESSLDNDSLKGVHLSETKKGKVITRSTRQIVEYSDTSDTCDSVIQPKPNLESSAPSLEASRECSSSGSDSVADLEEMSGNSCHSVEEQGSENSDSNATPINVVDFGESVSNDVAMLSPPHSSFSLSSDDSGDEYSDALSALDKRDGDMVQFPHISECDDSSKKDACESRRDSGENIITEPVLSDCIPSSVKLSKSTKSSILVSNNFCSFTSNQKESDVAKQKSLDAHKLATEHSKECTGYELHDKHVFLEDLHAYKQDKNVLNKHDGIINSVSCVGIKRFENLDQAKVQPSLEKLPAVPNAASPSSNTPLTQKQHSLLGTHDSPHLTHQMEKEKSMKSSLSSDNFKNICIETEINNDKKSDMISTENYFGNSEKNAEITPIREVGNAINSLLSVKEPQVKESYISDSVKSHTSPKGKSRNCVGIEQSKKTIPFVSGNVLSKLAVPFFFGKFNPFRFPGVKFRIGGHFASEFYPEPYLVPKCPIFSFGQGDFQQLYRLLKAKHAATESMALVRSEVKFYKRGPFAPPHFTNLYLNPKRLALNMGHRRRISASHLNAESNSQCTSDIPSTRCLEESAPKGISDGTCTPVCNSMEKTEVLSQENFSMQQDDQGNSSESCSLISDKVDTPVSSDVAVNDCIEMAHGSQSAAAVNSETANQTSPIIQQKQFSAPTRGRTDISEKPNESAASDQFDEHPRMLSEHELNDNPLSPKPEGNPMLPGDNLSLAPSEFGKEAISGAVLTAIMKDSKSYEENATSMGPKGATKEVSQKEGTKHPGTVERQLVEDTGFTEIDVSCSSDSFCIGGSTQEITSSEGYLSDKDSPCGSLVSFDMTEKCCDRPVEVNSLLDCSNTIMTTDNFTKVDSLKSNKSNLSSCPRNTEEATPRDVGQQFENYKGVQPSDDQSLFSVNNNDIPVSVTCSDINLTSYNCIEVDLKKPNFSSKPGFLSNLEESTSRGVGDQGELFRNNPLLSELVLSGCDETRMSLKDMSVSEISRKSINVGYATAKDTNAKENKDSDSLENMEKDAEDKGKTEKKDNCDSTGGLGPTGPVIMNEVNREKLLGGRNEEKMNDGCLTGDEGIEDLIMTMCPDGSIPDASFKDNISGESALFDDDGGNLLNIELPLDIVSFAAKQDEVKENLMDIFGPDNGNKNSQTNKEKTLEEEKGSRLTALQIGTEFFKNSLSEESPYGTMSGSTVPETGSVESTVVTAGGIPELILKEKAAEAMHIDKCLMAENLDALIELAGGLQSLEDGCIVSDVIELSESLDEENILCKSPRSTEMNSGTANNVNEEGVFSENYKDFPHASELVEGNTSLSSGMKMEIKPMSSTKLEDDLEKDLSNEEDSGVCDLLLKSQIPNMSTTEESVSHSSSGAHRSLHFTGHSNSAEHGSAESGVNSANCHLGSKNTKDLYDLTDGAKGSEEKNFCGDGEPNTLDIAVDKTNESSVINCNGSSNSMQVVNRVMVEKLEKIVCNDVTHPKKVSYIEVACNEKMPNAVDEDISEANVEGEVENGGLEVPPCNGEVAKGDMNVSIQSTKPATGENIQREVVTGDIEVPLSDKGGVTKEVNAALQLTKSTLEENEGVHNLVESSDSVQSKRRKSKRLSKQVQNIKTEGTARRYQSITLDSADDQDLHKIPDGSLENNMGGEEPEPTSGSASPKKGSIVKKSVQKDLFGCDLSDTSFDSEPVEDRIPIIKGRKKRKKNIIYSSESEDECQNTKEIRKNKEGPPSAKRSKVNRRRKSLKSKCEAIFGSPVSAIDSSLVSDDNTCQLTTRAMVPDTINSEGMKSKDDNVSMPSANTKCRKENYMPEKSAPSQSKEFSSTEMLSPHIYASGESQTLNHHSPIQMKPTTLEKKDITLPDKSYDAKLLAIDDGLLAGAITSSSKEVPSKEIEIKTDIPSVEFPSSRRKTRKQSFVGTIRCDDVIFYGEENNEEKLSPRKKKRNAPLTAAIVSEVTSNQAATTNRAACLTGELNLKDNGKDNITCRDEKHSESSDRCSSNIPELSPAVDICITSSLNNSSIKLHSQIKGAEDETRTCEEQGNAQSLKKGATHDSKVSANADKLHIKNVNLQEKDSEGETHCLQKDRYIKPKEQVEHTLEASPALNKITTSSINDGVSNENFKVDNDEETIICKEEGYNLPYKKQKHLLKESLAVAKTGDSIIKNNALRAHLIETIGSKEQVISLPLKKRIAHFPEVTTSATKMNTTSPNAYSSSKEMKNEEEIACEDEGNKPPPKKNVAHAPKLTPEGGSVNASPAVIGSPSDTSLREYENNTIGNQDQVYEPTSRKRTVLIPMATSSTKTNYSSQNKNSSDEDTKGNGNSTGTPDLEVPYYKPPTKKRIAHAPKLVPDGGSVNTSPPVIRSPLDTSLRENENNTIGNQDQEYEPTSRKRTVHIPMATSSTKTNYSSQNKNSSDEDTKGNGNSTGTPDLEVPYYKPPTKKRIAHAPKLVPDGGSVNTSPPVIRSPLDTSLRENENNTIGNQDQEYEPTSRKRTVHIPMATSSTKTNYSSQNKNSSDEDTKGNGNSTGTPDLEVPYYKPPTKKRIAHAPKLVPDGGSVNTSPPVIRSPLDTSLRENENNTIGNQDQVYEPTSRKRTVHIPMATSSTKTNYSSQNKNSSDEDTKGNGNSTGTPDLEVPYYKPPTKKRIAHAPKLVPDGGSVNTSPPVIRSPLDTSLRENENNTIGNQDQEYEPTSRKRTVHIPMATSSTKTNYSSQNKNSSDEDTKGNGNSTGNPDLEEPYYKPPSKKRIAHLPKVLSQSSNADNLDSSFSEPDSLPDVSMDNRQSKRSSISDSKNSNNTCPKPKMSKLGKLRNLVSRAKGYQPSVASASRSHDLSRSHAHQGGDSSKRKDSFSGNDNDTEKSCKSNQQKTRRSPRNEKEEYGPSPKKRRSSTEKLGEPPKTGILEEGYVQEEDAAMKPLPAIDVGVAASTSLQKAALDGDKLQPLETSLESTSQKQDMNLRSGKNGVLTFGAGHEKLLEEMEVPPLSPLSDDELVDSLIIFPDSSESLGEEDIDKTPECNTSQEPTLESNFKEEVIPENPLNIDKEVPILKDGKDKLKLKDGKDKPGMVDTTAASERNDINIHMGLVADMGNEGSRNEHFQEFPKESGTLSNGSGSSIASKDCITVGFEANPIGSATIDPSQTNPVGTSTRYPEDLGNNITPLQLRLKLESLSSEWKNRKDYFNKTLKKIQRDVEEEKDDDVEAIMPEVNRKALKTLLKKLNSKYFGNSILNTVVGSISPLNKGITPRILSKYLVRMLSKEDEDDVQPAPIPGAPRMTPLQLRVLCLVLALENRCFNFKDLTEVMLAGMSFILFRLGRCPDVEVVKSLARMYTALCMAKKDILRVRCFCFDALFTIGSKAVELITVVLSMWHEVLPVQDSGRVPNYIETSVFMAISHLAERRNAPMELQKRIGCLKMVIRNMYKSEHHRVSIDMFLDKLMLNLTEGRNLVGLETAVMLLAKRQGWEWTHKNLLCGRLVSVMEAWKEDGPSRSSAVAAINLIGLTARSCPMETGGPIKVIIEVLSRTLLKEPCDDSRIKEALVLSLIRLSKYHFYHVIRALDVWRPMCEPSKEVNDAIRMLVLRPSLQKFWKEKYRSWNKPVVNRYKKGVYFERSEPLDKSEIPPEGRKKEDEDFFEWIEDEKKAKAGAQGEAQGGSQDGNRWLPHRNRLSFKVWVQDKQNEEWVDGEVKKWDGMAFKQSERKKKKAKKKK